MSYELTYLNRPGRQSTRRRGGERADARGGSATLAILGTLAAVAVALSTAAGQTAQVCTLGLVLIGVAALSLDLAAVLVLVVSLVLVQPFALGAGHTILGSGIACAAGLIALISDSTAIHERADRPMKSVLVWVTLSAAWMVALATQHSGLDVSAAERTCEALFAVLASAVLVLRNSARRLWFVRSVIIVMAAFSLSYAVSFLIWFKDGFGSHLVGSLNVRGYGSNPVYFPFTPTSGASVVAGRVIPRLLGPLREPGLCQAILIWSYFMLERVGLRRRSLQIVLIAGVLATQSTAGLGIFLVVRVLVFMMANDSGHAHRLTRQIAGLFVLVGALYLAVFAPTIGIVAKQSSNAASIGDRWSNTQSGLTALVEAPLGRDQTTYGTNVAINLLASATVVGAPGLLLGLAAFVRPMVLTGRRKDAVASGLPLLLTALVAQPVMDAPAFFVLLMAGLALYPPQQSEAVPVPVESREERFAPRLQPA